VIERYRNITKQARNGEGKNKRKSRERKEKKEERENRRKNQAAIEKKLIFN
jgi:hypothetical protein